MGNADSSLLPPAKPAGSLGCSSRREEVPSARSWWSSSQRSGRSRRRSHQGPHAAAGWHYERAPSAGGGAWLTFGHSGAWPLEAHAEGRSPDVLLAKDGGMTVLTRPLEAVATATSPAAGRGSSLSSDGSSYDSPGGGAPAGGGGRRWDSSSTLTSSLLRAACDAAGSSGRTDDSGVGASLLLEPDPRQQRQPRAADSSPSYRPLEDVILGAESSVEGVERPLCAATASVNHGKDFLKSRVKRLSSWTGSLSRKKRRTQEPNALDSAHIADLLQCSNQNQLLVGHRGSSWDRDQDQDQDAQQQNTYDDFLQHLQTGRWSRTVDGPEEEAEEEEEEEEEEVFGDAGGGGSGQLDLLQEQGGVRRAGWLAFKPLIAVSRNRKLELVARRRWRRYWVTLKGCSLLLYESHGGGAERRRAPRHALRADGGLAQAVPEHPRREHVFCLSNAHGDVYLLQASAQTDLEDWVTAVHSASAALLARREGEEDTRRLLERRCRSLLRRIDADGKTKKMAELQLSVIKDARSRAAAESQISQWEQNLEKLNLDLFRFRCYLSSLQGGELPNPKSLLAAASRPSKCLLGRLGVFSVSSFHALVCSRDEDTLRRRHLFSTGNQRRRAVEGLRGRREDPSQSNAQSRSGASQPQGVAPSAGRPAAQQGADWPPAAGRVFTLHVRGGGADEDVGFAVTGHVDGAGSSRVFVSQVDPRGRTARDGLLPGDEVLAVDGSPVSGLDLDLMPSLFRRPALQMLLRREGPSGGEEPAGARCPPPLPVCVETRLRDAAEWAEQVTSCDFLAFCLPCSSCSLTMGALCWVLPQDEDGETLQGGEEEEERGEALPGLMRRALEEAACCRRCRRRADILLNMEQGYSLYRTFPEGRAADADVPRNPYAREAELQPASPAHLSICQRLRKVIEELVDTEKSYVKDLVCLFDTYLSPLQKEDFISTDEMEALFGSLPGMLDFQRVFLQTLEERLSACPNLSGLETPEQFRVLLVSLGGSFLHYADHFKLYSGFCANHMKVQKVLERARTDAAFKHFLETRNPTNQHSSSLESYLIKPVQRVLKYPLLLREMVSLTEPQSPEHTHLTEALRAMEEVASHINEMQKVYEDYGRVFDQLAAERSGRDGRVTDTSMGDFLLHSSAVWMNPLPGVGRLRKEPQLMLFVFTRAVILVYRDSVKLRKKMTISRSADLDPFRFRWLIPVSAVQVQPASITGSEDPCAWELVHRRSEVEGRPETVFQLCSRDLQTKADVLQVLRSLLRDRAPVASLRRRPPPAGPRSASWRRRQQVQLGVQAPGLQPEEERCEETHSEPLLPSRASSSCSPSAAAAGRRSRLRSLTGELEVQLQRLCFSEEEVLRRRHAGEAQDLSSMLERDFSVQSLSSIINEECFYDSAANRRRPAAAALHG